MPRLSDAGGCFWHSTCLKPTYSLRRQLLISFGVTGILTTSLVVILACLCAIMAGNVVQQEARNFMGREVIYSISNSSQNAAETFSEELDHLRGTVSLVVEIVRDRIAGYPREGWDDDLFVPFKADDGTTNLYPLKSPLLPRDWNSTINVNMSNYEEHLQELLGLLEKQHAAGDGGFPHSIIPDDAQPKLGTASATYSFQGNCDPSVADPADPTFYENCTDANNDGTTGGVIWPTNTSAGLERKAADIGTMLKPIWESRSDVLVVSVHFVNEGAGSLVHFPAFVHDNDPRAYQSIGCEWLHENINPFTERPFLSREQTARCHPKGAWVSRRDFNPLEQEWCRDQALHPNETRFYGPITDKFFTPGVLDQKKSDHQLFFWIMRVGRAVFDRYTGEFIGCVSLSVLTNRWTELVLDTLAVQNYSSAVLVRSDDGTVVAGGDWSLYNKNKTTNISELDFIHAPHGYNDLAEILEQVKRDHEQNATQEVDRFATIDEKHVGVPTAYFVCASGRVVSASALPGSDFVYIQVVGEEVFDVILGVKQHIDRDVVYSTLVALLIGGIGVTILLVIVWTVSRVLTKPLNWIQQVAWSIVNHTDASVERQSLRVDDMEGTDPAIVEKTSSSQKENAFAYKSSSTCTPKSEVTELVQEFKQMIRGFSGAGRASTVAKATPHEIRNTLVWQSDFQRLYRRAKATELGDFSNSCEAENVLPSLSLHRRQSESDLDLNSESEDKIYNGPEPDGGPMATIEKFSGDCGDAEEVRSVRSGAEEKKDSAVRREIVSMDIDSGAKPPGSSRTLGELPDASDCLFRSSKRDISESARIFPARTEPPSKSETIAPRSSTTETTATVIVPFMDASQGWRNEGRNFTHSFMSTKLHDHDQGSCIPVGSSLFRWIWILIVIPLIITNVVIVITVSHRITSVLPQWLRSVDEASFQIQSQSLSVTSKFASLYAEASLASPMRDLFLFTRLSEWLFTGAIGRQLESFVDMQSGSEECKGYTEDVTLCPWYDDIFNHAPCDCSWEVPSPKNCFLMGKSQDTRRMQQLFYSGQRHDADLATGRRVNTSFPEVDGSPPETAWWANISDVPGAFKGRRASGYETTYDRLRVFSATSAIMFPLYNYRTSLVSKGEHRFVGAYFGFEADGMFAGWAGCRHPSPTYPHFLSTEANHASKINETLCPLGKYGYDARCRGWYDTGRNIALNEANATTSLYITSPYEFASDPSLRASSATQAVIDPRTGEHIGQTLIDFLQFEMLHFGLRRNNDNFHFVITPSGDSGGADTVIGPAPGQGGDSGLGAIGDLILPYDDANSTNRLGFDAIVSDMKLGNSCFQNFSRTTIEYAEDGEAFRKEQSYRLAYDPIHVRALDSVQCDDYSRGVKVSKSLVYSLGVGRTEESLQKPFKEFEEDAIGKLHGIVSVYISATVLISILAIAVACRVSVAVTRPMIILLRVVQNINSGKIDDDIPPLHGGSREVCQVYTSFAKLYKIVRVSNSAFFSRNLHWACHFVRDALKLFTKIDDKKAIAIASANLGSTLLAINCGRPQESRCNCLELDSVCCVKEAFLHFERAVSSGTEDFTNATDMTKKAEFAEQLSDRLFNRGLYFLLSKEDPCATEDYEELGLQDLVKAQALDHDVQEYWINNGLLMEKSCVLFDRLMRRLNGLCALLENDITQNIWNAESLVHDCHRLLSAAWENPNLPIFEETTQVGRLQQLEGALIHLELQRGHESEAARVAMRMLVEDEFINEWSFQSAADAILQYMTHGISSDQSQASSWSILTKASLQRDIRNMLKSCKQTSLQTRKCLFLCVELADDQHLMNPGLKSQLLSLYESHCGADDYFGLVALNGNTINSVITANSGNGMIQVDLECKRHKENEQRSSIESAIDFMEFSPTSSFGSLEFRLKTTKYGGNKSYKALGTALDKVLQSEASALYDSYILYVTDGPKRNWDLKALLSLKSKIEDMNAKRRGDVHLIILDLEVTANTALSTTQGGTQQRQEGEDGFVSTCKNLCRVSQGSVYVKASLNTLEDNFDEVRSCLSVGNCATAGCSNALLSGITMEKF